MGNETNGRSKINGKISKAIRKHGMVGGVGTASVVSIFFLFQSIFGVNIDNNAKNIQDITLKQVEIQSQIKLLEKVPEKLNNIEDGQKELKVMIMLLGKDNEDFKKWKDLYSK